MPAAEDDLKTKEIITGEGLVPFGSCPLPFFDHKQIVLGHGSGGKLTSDLIDKIFSPPSVIPRSRSWTIRRC